MAHELPTTALRNSSEGTFISLGQWAYNVTEGMFWVFALLGFCAATFIASVRLGNNRAFAFSSFVAISGSIWFAVMGFMSWWISSLFILVGLVGLVSMINSKN